MRQHSTALLALLLTAGLPVAACDGTADVVIGTAEPDGGATTDATIAVPDSGSTCKPGEFRNGTACTPCSGACPSGQRQGAACTATQDRTCVDCGALANCAERTCSDDKDQRCTRCAPGFFLKNGACEPCSTGVCATGSFESAKCSPTADRVCTTCTAIGNCTSGVTCTNATDQQCMSCGAGFFLKEGAGGAADTCAACTPCGAGKYETTACLAAADRVCSDCTAIPNCMAGLSCTSATNQQCTTCAAGFYLVDGAADTCERAKSCADIKLRNAAAADGVYTVDPDGAGGVDPFSVYCDMTANGGGWTLIGKVGNGKWPELTNQQYIDLFAHPTADVNAAALQTGALPGAKTIAFYRKDKTNALYHARAYAGQSVVRVIFDSAENNDADGTYFQQRKVDDAAWDFWSALRDSRRWSRQASNNPPNVTNYGVDFAVTRAAASFNAATNTVTHATGGDTSFGWWDQSPLTLADGSTLAVSRHGGLLCDGVENRGWLWLLTTNPTDGRFKNEDFETKSSIWLR